MIGVIPFERVLKITRGEDKQYIPIRRFAYNKNAQVGLDLWNGTGEVFQPDTAFKIDIVSDSIEDDWSKPGAGEGAREVIISGLDANYKKISEVKRMNGTTRVRSANSYLRLDRVILKTVGTAGSNVGKISFYRLNMTEKEMGIIDPGVGQTQNGLYTVPLDYKGVYFSSLNLDMSKDVELGFFIRNPGEPWRLISIYNTPQPRSLDFPPFLRPKTDFKFQVLSAPTLGIGEPPIRVGVIFTLIGEMPDRND